MGSMCLQLGLLSARGPDASGSQRRTRLGWRAWVTWQSLCLLIAVAASWVSGNRDHSGVFSPLSDVVYSPLLKLMLCLTDHYVKGARTSMCLSDLRCILVLPTPFRVSVAPLTQPVDS